jgi:Tfp pilus assembly protein PilF
VRYFPEDPRYRQQLGWTHLQTARTAPPDAAGPEAEVHLAAAERELTQALARRPDDYMLARTLAEFHGAVALQFDRSHLGSAEKIWKKTIELAPNHAILYGAWGRLRLQAGDTEGARTLLEKTVDLDATDAETWLLLADLELQRQQPTSALVMYRRAARHAPDRGEPLVGLARTYWLLGQPEAARQTVLEALELDPQNGAAASLRLEFSEQR